jgi:type II secretory pathway predicted ATPase ExeA
MIDLRNHYGFTRTPFGKDLAPSMLHHYPGHAEAVARITWCARERAVAVITGEVGAGKTVAARAAIAGLDQTRHTLIYLADPTTGTRGIHHTVVTALGGRPPTAPPPWPPRPPACSPPSITSAAVSRCWSWTRLIS